MKRVLYTPSKLADILRIVASRMEEFETYRFEITTNDAIDPQDGHFVRLDYKNITFPELRVFKENRLVLQVQVQDSSTHIQENQRPLAIFVHAKQFPDDLVKPIAYELSKNFGFESYEINR